MGCTAGKREDGPENRAKMITISEFQDREDALISKALLEAAGVPVMLREESGRLDLLVRETDARLAHEVLVGSDPDERPIFLPIRRRRRPSHGGGFLRFVAGGWLATAGILCLLLLLIPLGIQVRVTPFFLLLTFVLGGCAGVIRGSVRIRRRVPVDEEVE